MGKRIKVVINIVTWILIGIVIALAILLAGLRLLGFEIYSVVSGSMEPDILTGSLVYVKEIEAHQLKEGDIITFMEKQDVVVTHRIMSVDIDDGQYRFWTYGINNYERDDAGNAVLDENGNIKYWVDAVPVHERNVIGKTEFTVPYVGYVSDFISDPPGLYIAIAFGLLLVLLVFLPDLLFPASKDDSNAKGKTPKDDNDDDKALPDTTGDKEGAEPVQDTTADGSSDEETVAL